MFYVIERDCWTTFEVEGIGIWYIDYHRVGVWVGKQTEGYVDEQANWKYHRHVGASEANGSRKSWDVLPQNVLKFEN